MTLMARPLAALAALALILAAFPAFSAQFFVANSTAPGLEAGQIIDGDKPLVLPAGARATLIGPDGKTITLTGPLEGPPGGGDGGDTSLFATLSNLVNPPDASIAMLGTTREGSLARPDDPFTIALGVSGDHCMPAGERIQLWRADSETARLLTVWPVAGSIEAATETSWPEGAATLPWPEELTPEDGATYLIRLAGGGSSSEIVLHRIQATLPSEVHRIAWMAQQGCTRQALMLLEALD